MVYYECKDSLHLHRRTGGCKQKELPSFEEVYAIVKGTDSELPVLLAAWLSLRIGEVIGLQYKDVDEVNHTIHVQRTIVLTEIGYEVREGCKTEKSERYIHIPDYLLNMIMAQPHERETDFSYHGHASQCIANSNASWRKMV